MIISVNYKPTNPSLTFILGLMETEIVRRNHFTMKMPCKYWHLFIRSFFLYYLFFLLFSFWLSWPWNSQIAVKTIFFSATIISKLDSCILCIFVVFVTSLIISLACAVTSFTKKDGFNWNSYPNLNVNLFWNQILISFKFSPRYYCYSYRK